MAMESQTDTTDGFLGTANGTGNGNAGAAPLGAAGRKLNPSSGAGPSADTGLAIVTTQVTTQKQRDSSLHFDSDDSRESFATTAVSSPGRRNLPVVPEASRAAMPAPAHSTAMFFLVALAKLVSFADVFVSGLIIPLLPRIIEARVSVPKDQVQIWTSVLISTYGGSFAAVAPLLPYLTLQGPSAWGVQIAGLACTASTFAILQFSSDLTLWILARALHGLAAAATTGTCSGILAAAAGNGQTSTLSWITPALIQSVAMAAAPSLSGALYEYVHPDAVFASAYGILALSLLLGLLAVKFTPKNVPAASSRTLTVVVTGERTGGYGTIGLQNTGSQQSSPASSRSVSPRSFPTRLVGRDAAPVSLPTEVASTAWTPQLLVATYGYLVVSLLVTALQSVLPLFVERRFGWSASATGLMFVPLSAPAILIGPVARWFAGRVSRSARFSVSFGFLACVPAILHLGWLTKDTDAVHVAFLSILGFIAASVGLCGDPLVGEISRAVTMTGSTPANVPAQVVSLANVAGAWGILIGPLLAGAVTWVHGWDSMVKSLAAVSLVTGVIAFLFLQGWIGNPQPRVGLDLNPASDEESAPLLAGPHYNGASNDFQEQPVARSQPKTDNYASTDDSHTTQTTRNDHGGSRAKHRRHFSVDNFSIATTAAPGSLDSNTSQVRFQAALETPTGSSSGAPLKRQNTSDSSSRRSVERRYVMREAPHAPATDPLLAAGSRYVVDDGRRTSAAGTDVERPKKHVVVFEEGSAPPELLERHEHHIVAINSIDGTAAVVPNRAQDHAVSVTEETGEEPVDFSEETVRRYVVVVIEGPENGEEES